MVAKLSRDITATGYRKWKIYFADDLDVERWTNAFITNVMEIDQSIERTWRMTSQNTTRPRSSKPSFS